MARPVTSAPTPTSVPTPPPGGATRGTRSPSGWTGRRLLVARLTAAAAGGLAEFATAPPRAAWPLGILGTGLVVFAVRGARARTGALVGFVYGLALFLPLLSWLRHVGPDAWLLLTLVEAVWLAALGAGLALVARLPGWPAWVAAVWVAGEWARDRFPFGGFTWGRLAYGQFHSPLTPLAALGGAPLVTAAVALAGALLVVAVGAGVGRRAPVAAAAALAGALALVWVGLAVPVPTGGQPIRVAAVQGDVPRLGLDAFNQAYQVLRNQTAVTEGLASQIATGTRPPPAFVVWPENSSDLDPLTTPLARTLIDTAARAVGRPILVGAVLDGPGPHHVRNAGIVWDPRTGPGAIYVKRHLVPFGEYIPFRSLIGGLIGRFSLIPADFVPGHRPGVLRIGSHPIGDVICFEVTFDSAVRDVVTGGAQLLVVQTNDATFESPGDSGTAGESAQQLSVAQLRAVEHGRAVVVASTSGVSALVGPDGRIIARSGIFTPAILDATLPLRGSETIADRLGPIPDDVLAAIGLAALVVAGFRRRSA